MLVLITIYPILVIVSFCYRMLFCCKCCRKIQTKLNVFLFWNKPIVTLMEAYSMLSMCCLINIAKLGNSGTIDKLSTSLTIIFILIIVGFPIVIAIFLLWNFKKLDKPRYLQKYGVLYRELRYKESKWFILEPIAFLIRRLCLAMAVVLNRTLILQFLIMVSSVLAWVMLVTFTKPYASVYQ